MGPLGGELCSGTASSDKEYFMENESLQLQVLINRHFLYISFTS